MTRGIRELATAPRFFTHTDSNEHDAPAYYDYLDPIPDGVPRVWVVTAGEYSSHRIVSVFTTETAAQAYARTLVKTGGDGAFVDAFALRSPAEGEVP